MLGAISRMLQEHEFFHCGPGPLKSCCRINHSNFVPAGGGGDRSADDGVEPDRGTVA